MHDYESFLEWVLTVIDSGPKFRRVLRHVFSDNKWNLGRAVVVTEVAAKIVEKHPHIAQDILDEYLAVFANTLK